MARFFEVENELEDTLVKLRERLFVSLLKDWLKIVHKVRVQEGTKKCFSLDVMHLKDDLFLVFRCCGFPFLLLNLVIDTLNNEVMIDLHRLKQLHYLI